jgi:hypothetical protein
MAELERQSVFASCCCFNLWWDPEPICARKPGKGERNLRTNDQKFTGPKLKETDAYVYRISTDVDADGPKRGTKAPQQPLARVHVQSAFLQDEWLTFLSQTWRSVGVPRFGFRRPTAQGPSQYGLWSLGLSRQQDLSDEIMSNCTQ